MMRPGVGISYGWHFRKDMVGVTLKSSAVTAEIVTNSSKRALEKGSDLLFCLVFSRYLWLLNSLQTLNLKASLATTALHWHIALSMVICMSLLPRVCLFTILLPFRLCCTWWCAMVMCRGICSSQAPAHICWFTIWKVGRRGRDIHRGCWDEH